MKYLSYSVFAVIIFISQNVWATDLCFEDAGDRFGIQPALLESISYVESLNEPFAVAVNKNGSVDFGHMQINTWWVKELGESYLSLGEDPCFCTHVGARILAECIQDNGYNYDAISCYRSGKPLHRLSDDVRLDVLSYIKRLEKRFQELIQ